MGGWVGSGDPSKRLGPRGNFTSAFQIFPIGEVGNRCHFSSRLSKMSVQELHPLAFPSPLSHYQTAPRSAPGLNLLFSHGPILEGADEPLEETMGPRCHQAWPAPPPPPWVFLLFCFVFPLLGI